MTIENILREMRDFENVAYDGYDQYEAYQMLCWFADRIENAFSSMEAEKSRIISELNEVRELNRKCCDENDRLRDVVDALNNCDGVKRCIEKGCDSCRHNGHDCNSHEVVKALLEYRREDK